MPNKLLKYLFLILCVFSLNTYAQFQRANYQILGIRVEGNISADAATIIANSGLKVGDELEIPGDQTNNAIKRLWSLKIFADVKIEIEKKVENGAFIVIKVQELPRMESVLFEGNDEISDDEIQKVIILTKGQTLNPQKIYRIKMKIQKLYEDEGFLNALISPEQFKFLRADTTKDEINVTWGNVKDLTDEYETQYDFDPEMKIDVIGKSKDRVLLLFRINEGDEVKVKTITFNGNTAFENDDLIDELDETREEPAWWEFWASSTLNREDYEKDKKLLVDFYKKNGYRDFAILRDSISYSDDNKFANIIIDVFEGAQYKVRKIDWEGNTVYDDDVLNRRLDFYSGDIYNLEKFNQNLRGNEAQTDVAALYLDNGYLTFNLETLEERVATDSMDIKIKVIENNRFRVGQVMINGNDKTKDKVVRRELYTIPGDYFSRSNIFRSIQQLANLQYFNVEKLYQSGVDYRPINDSTVSLIYNVEEKSSDYLNASIGYSGAYGFSGAVGITLNNFSLSEPFQLGGGQVLNFNWQFGVGNYYRSFNVGFSEPWFLDTPTMLGFDLFDTRQRYVYDIKQTGITLRVGRRLTWPDNYFYIQGSLKFQYNDIIEGQSFYAEGLSRQYTLGMTISRTDIDNPIFPSKGSKFNLNTEISGGPILPGNVDYYKIELTNEWYQRLFNSNRLAFYASANIGYLDEIVEGTTIQPFEYFFMGGNGLIIATTPLRGYEDRTVGPQNESGNIVGGRVMAKYTTELRAALTLEPMPIYVLLFAEAGNCFYEFKSADLFNLRRSAGIGARILINPIGLIGFDYGYGFDRKEVDGQDNQWIFHFQFGRGF
ncbi:MAG: outer membrane protein assembly factor BamA [bacterium]